MTVKIPYSKLELQLASIRAFIKLEKVEDIDDLQKRLEGIDSPDLTQAVAAHYGIAVSELINSPNMPYMVEQWKLHCTEKAVKVLEEYGLTNVEAWSFILHDVIDTL